MVVNAILLFFYFLFSILYPCICVVLIIVFSFSFRLQKYKLFPNLTKQKNRTDTSLGSVPQKHTNSLYHCSLSILLPETHSQTLPVAGNCRLHDFNNAQNAPVVYYVLDRRVLPVLLTHTLQFFATELLRQSTIHIFPVADVAARAVPGALHNEAAWEKRIPVFMDYLL